VLLAAEAAAPPAWTPPPDEGLAGVLALLEVEDDEVALDGALAVAADAALPDDAPDEGLEAATGFNTVMAGAADETLPIAISLPSRSNSIFAVSHISADSRF